jgi:predicted permease
VTRDEREARLREEVELHIALAADAFIRRGMSPEDALRRARVAFGGAEHFKDEARDQFRSPLRAAIAQDVRYALRMARRAPALTAIAIITLGTAIALATSAFTAVNSVLLRTLPYPASDRLALVWGTVRGSSDHNPVSFTNAMDWRRDTHAFASLAAFSCAPRPILAVRGLPARASMMDVSADFFRVLSAHPLLGRLFDSTDFVAPEGGSADVVVLTWGIWRDRFASDPSVVGSRVLLDAAPVTVIGVLPRTFSPLPTSLACRPDLYRPLASRYDDAQRRWTFLKVVARLTPGATVHQAQAELDVENARLAEAHPETNRGMGARAVSLGASLTQPLRPLLVLAQVGALLVLLIACANVASLLLARATVRRRELSIRVAMGASRARLTRQIATECLMLGVAAMALGLGLTIATTGALTALAGDALPDPRGFAVDWSVVAFALIASLGATFVFGLAAVIKSRGDGAWLIGALRDGGRGSTVARSRLGRAIVSTQLAVATLVLLGALLLARSYGRLRAVDAGFSPSNVTTARVSLPDATYPRGAKQVAFFDQVLARIVARRGVVAAGAVSILPESPNFDRTAVRPEGRTYAPNEQPTPDVYRATPGYFAAMRIPLRAGRLFTATDDDRHPLVAVIDESMARALFPGRSPLGERMWTGAGNAERTIVGVVGDVYQYGLDSLKTMQLYVPHADNSGGDLTLVVRSLDGSVPASAMIRDAVRATDPGVPVDDILTMDQVLSESASRRRLLARVSLAFGLGAMGLAAIGLYGLIAFAVEQRTQEIGVRMAMGATRRRVLGLVLGDTSRLVLRGAAIGLAAAACASGLMAPFLFGVGVTDPVAIALAPALLLLVALGASAAPALRAARVNPAVALRNE